jgi:hypothetical protein
MKRHLITAAALVALAALAAGAVGMTAQNSQRLCIPSAVVQAWS